MKNITTPLPWQKKINGRTIPFFILILPLLIISCAGTPKGDLSSREVQKSKPDWISKYPVSDAYFIGVASSNTGDQGSDMEQARLKAVAALASSISTEISGEITSISGDDTSGRSYDSINTVIKETVNKKLEYVEVVDSYYSASDGYWFYVRLDKKRWQAIENKEKEDLKNRIIDLTSPVFASGGIPLVERFSLIEKGLSILEESVYGSVLSGSLGGEDGIFSDILEKKINSLLSSLYLSLTPENITIKQGEQCPVSLKAGNTLSIQSGRVPVKIIFNDKIVAAAATDINGIFTGSLPAGTFPVGKSSFTAMVDLSFLNSGKRFTANQIPQKGGDITVEPVTLFLKVETDDEEKVNNIYNSVKSLISGKFGFSISEKPDGPLALFFSLSVRKVPDSGYGILFSYAKGTFRLLRYGRTLYSYESGEYKDGGLTEEQARERSVNKLFTALNADTALKEGISAALSR